MCRTPFLNSAPLDGNGVCGLCRAGATQFDAAYSFGSYDGALRKLIHLLKYEGVKPLAKPLGRLLARAMPLEQPFDWLVPLPLHWKRRLRRGFNQSELLAGELSRRTGIPVCRTVRRKRSTESQAQLTNAGRRANVAGAFQVKDAKSVHGKRLLLVDDVLTTGATVNACSSALKRAGAARVSVLTLARVDRRPPREILNMDVVMPAAIGGVTE